MSTEDPIRCALRLIAEAEALALMPGNHGADKILAHRELIQCLREIVDFHRGYSDWTRRLTGLVSELLSVTLQASPTASMPSWTELKGKAGTPFRAKLREIAMHLDTMEPPREH